MRKSKKEKFNNFGNEIQAYDVVFEVSKLDAIKEGKGKESEEYKKQHSATVRLINKFNDEIKGRALLNISRCRSIMQMPREQNNVEFYKAGKETV